MSPAKQLLRITSFFCLLLLVCVSCNAATDAIPTLQGEVSWIYDGDTLMVDGIGKVRLIGIDTPEKDDSPRDDFYRRWNIAPQQLRNVARQALEFCITEAKGRVVTLTVDKTPRDRHGRLLAYVHLPDSRMLNRLLLERGLATVYRRFEFVMKEDFLAAERQARAQKTGLWQHQ